MALAEFPVYSVPSAAANAQQPRVAVTWAAWGWGLVWTVAAAATLPLIVAYLRYLWRFEHYRYFPFLLLFCSVAAHQRWDGRIHRPAGLIGWGGMLGSLLLLAAGGLLGSPWFGSAALVLLAAAFLWSHHEPDGRRLIYLCFPLLLLVRLPLNYDHHIVVGLQGVTTRISSFVLDMVAVPHDVLGTVILLPDRQMLVAEACSGVQSAFTLMFIALACAAWNRRPLLLLPLSIALALLWAVLANVLRVSTIAGAAYALDLDLAAGWPHEVLGYSVLIVAILLVFSSDRMQACLFHPLSENDSARTGNPLIDLWETVFGPRLMAAGAASGLGPSAVAGLRSQHGGSTFGRRAAQTGRGLVGFAVLLLFAAAGAGPLWIAAASAESSTTTRLAESSKPAFFVPPPSITGGTVGPVAFGYSRQVRDGSDPRLGTHADVWDVRHAAFMGELVFSQPYDEWKQLSNCYVVLEWQQTDERHVISSAPGVNRTPVVVCRFHRESGEHGTLLFAGFHDDGQIQPPPGRNVISRMIGRCQQLLTETPYQHSLYDPRQHAMLQLWIPSNQPLPDAALADALDAFATLRDRFSEAIVDAQQRRPGAGRRE